MFKVNYENTRKRCEISPQLRKHTPKEGRLKDITDSDIHSSSCEDSYFCGSDAASDVEL